VIRELLYLPADDSPKAPRTSPMPTILLCFFANILCFLDRVNISIAAPFIMQAYGWDEARMGIVFSAFFAGYVLFMIPSGVLADRYGTTGVFAGGVAFWSLFTFATPFFSRIASMSVCRFLVGAGQGVNFPCINNFIAQKIPLSHRAKVQGFTLSGVTIGSVLGLPLGSWIIGRWGWPAIFYVFGMIGGLWIALWTWSSRIDIPDAGASVKPDREATPWKNLLCHRSAVGLSCSYFCHNYAGYLFLTWLPTYLIQVHGFSITATGIGAAVPPLASGVCMNASGWLSDYLIKKGKSCEFSRKILLFTGMGCSGCLLILLPWIHHPVMVVGVITLSSAAKALSTPVYWTLTVDMAPKHAGILSSIMNTAGNLAGIAAAVLTGWIVSGFSDWNMAIYVGAAVTLLGVAVAVPTVRASEIA